jgi:hypothetical protein
VTVAPSRKAAAECSPPRKRWVLRRETIQPRRGERQVLTHSIKKQRPLPSQKHNLSGPQRGRSNNENLNYGITACTGGVDFGLSIPAAFTDVAS